MNPTQPIPVEPGPAKIGACRGAASLLTCAGRAVAHTCRVAGVAVLGGGGVFLAATVRSGDQIDAAPFLVGVACGAAAVVSGTRYLRRTGARRPAQPGPLADRLGRLLVVRLAYTVVAAALLAGFCGGLAMLIEAYTAARAGAPWQNLAGGGVLAAVLARFGTHLVEHPRVAALAGGWPTPGGWLDAIAHALMARITGAEQMSAADRARWARARSLTDVGELVAQWLEGRIDSQPNYGGPVDVDEDDAPGLTQTLVLLNRAGFVTSQSQAGRDTVDVDGTRWRQYAAVRGFATPETVDWLRDTVIDPAGGTLVLTICRPAGRLGWTPIEPVTFGDSAPFTDFGSSIPESDLRHAWTGYGVCHTGAVDALVAAHQIVVRDTEPGGNDRLWPALCAAAERRLAGPPDADPATRS